MRRTIFPRSCGSPLQGAGSTWARHLLAVVPCRHDSTRTNPELRSRRATEREAYQILGIGHEAGPAEIKATFRTLAKQYHPDLAIGDSTEGASAKMAELVAAYDALMGSDLAGKLKKGTWNKLALHCEIYEVAQLRRQYDVHTVRLQIERLTGEKHPDITASSSSSSSSSSIAETPAAAELSACREWPVSCHPYDSAADLKRELQERYGAEWGLHEAPDGTAAGEYAEPVSRGLDRDGLIRGWELLPETMREQPGESEVLCTHFLLRDYGLLHGDVVYAIIGE